MQWHVEFDQKESVVITRLERGNRPTQPGTQIRSSVFAGWRQAPFARERTSQQPNAPK